MIELLTGDNDYELTQAVRDRQKMFDGHTERYDASELVSSQLGDIFGGQTLFALNRLVILNNPSANGDLWNNLETWLKRVSDDTHVVLVEPKLDKRTSAYKWLQKNVDIRQFGQIDERDTNTIAKWAENYAKQTGVGLTAHQARRIVGKAGADQWVIAHAIDKLGLLPAVTDEWIDDILEPRTTESVFALFETALNGDTERLQDMLESLRRAEEPYRVYGLIISQALQLVALVHGGGNVNKVAADTGAKSSYPFQKLTPYANRLTKHQAGDIIQILADGDKRLKSSDADPWMVLESSLVQVASLVKQ